MSYAVEKRNKLNLLGSVIPVGYFIVRLAFALLLGEGVRKMITSLVGNLVFTFIYVLLFVSGRQRFNKDKLIK
ncbi:hypothetical protein [Lactiplantibacillus plantarum]|uniref:hypothetical protein n=1 Tax=Lactiplantibacillus plantarum TaxID=1590 RepID=UPI0026587E4D|nr:hypothetical protein [Lactiplantibacillus plantarum]